MRAWGSRKALLRLENPSPEGPAERFLPPEEVAERCGVPPRGLTVAPPLEVTAAVWPSRLPHACTSPSQA
jgi:hypothetical protein